MNPIILNQPLFTITPIQNDVILEPNLNISHTSVNVVDPILVTPAPITNTLNINNDSQINSNNYIMNNFENIPTSTTLLSPININVIVNQQTNYVFNPITINISSTQTYNVQI